MITRRNFIKITAAGSMLATVGETSQAKASLQSVLPDAEFAAEEKREIPVLTETDIVVIGGSTRAVAAAVATARTGCRVFLAAEMPYLGDDICGSFLVERREDEKLQTGLSRKIYLNGEPPQPLQIKAALENELIDQNIDFLYSSYATNILTDSFGRPTGVVIANRSGRQAIKCKSIIDATQTAVVARMCGIPMQHMDAYTGTFEYTVVGNQPKESPEIIRSEVLPQPFSVKGKDYPITRYTFAASWKSDDYGAMMTAEQKVRSLTWDPDQVDSADLLWYIPEQTIQGKQSFQAENISTPRRLPLEAFQPKGFDNIWVIGPCADIHRKAAAKMMRPVNALFLGELLGEEIGYKVKELPNPRSWSVAGNKMNGFNYGAAKEVLKPLRAVHTNETIPSPAGALPVWGKYDVVVLGGGTAGASAGISSARHGSKTLVLEHLHGLGGLSTFGLIGRYWDGYRQGYSRTIDEGVRAMAPEEHPRQLPNWEEEAPSDWKAEWLRKELIAAGGNAWFGVLGCGALVENNKVKGLIVATPFGRGVILSDILIDSTGSADIAIAAGAAFDYTGKKTLAVQGAGMGKRDPGDSYVNNDWLFADDTDIRDVTRIYIQSKVKMQGHYDMVKLPQTRERRRVIGEHIVSVYDVINHRRYADTISYHVSSFDTHGMIVDPYFILSPPLERHTVYDADVPLRSLLPKGLDGILTTGLGASAHRDAMPVIRMQPCLQNQGYAVGYLSALCIKEKKSLRKADIKKVQKHLVSIGNLPERVLTDKEFKGFSKREMQQAADQVTDNYTGLGILLTQPDESLRLLRERIVKTSSFDDKVTYASILCILGNSEYASLLAEKINQYSEWDQGWNYTGMHQFGMSLSTLDALIIAMGNAKVKETLPAVLTKAKLLEPEDYFSHFRAVAMATEAINSRDAIADLAAMLTKPGVRGHAINTYAEAQLQTVPGWEDVSTRNYALKELHLARALYLCGDKEGIGEAVLRRYASSLQGHYARYASEILELS